MKGKSVTTSFLAKKKKVEKLDLVTKLPIYQIRKEHVGLKIRLNTFMKW